MDTNGNEQLKKQIQETLEPTLDEFQIVMPDPYSPNMAELRGALGNMRFAYMVDLVELGSPDRLSIADRLNFLKEKIHKGIAVAK